MACMVCAGGAGDAGGAGGAALGRDRVWGATCLISIDERYLIVAHEILVLHHVSVYRNGARHRMKASAMACMSSAEVEITKPSRSRRKRPPRARRTHKQLAMEFRTRGGKRQGAGRKPVTARGGRVRAGVGHRTRPAHNKAVPVHITVTIADEAMKDTRTLRRRDCYRLLYRAFVRGCTRNRDIGSFRICHYSVQRNHIHLIVEASSRAALSRGMQGFNIRLAKSINKLLGRTGKVLGDRYHEEPLATPRQVRNTLIYVINNARRHGEHRDVLPHQLPTWLDPYSSARYFDGWHERCAMSMPPPGEPCPVAPAETWLLAQGWRKHGTVPMNTMPAAGR
jgi:REP element-mobilizing transposase RayT